MRATRLSFVRVARGQAPSPAALRDGVAEVSDFLVAHAMELLARARDGSAANGTFGDPANRQLIEDIRSGSDSDFLAAADLLGQRLTGEMNKVTRPAPGLFVCTTIQAYGDAAEPLGVVLKLEVVSEQGAVLKRLDSGEETLAAVTDVLDRPGELQKGLVFPDVRATSDVVLGDKAAQQEARYFLRAMGVTLEARDATTAASLVSAVNARAGRSVAGQVVDALPTVEAAPVDEVLTRLRAALPSLSEEVTAAVAADLRQAERPVVRIDTSAPVTGKVRAGAITLSGPASEVRNVTWEVSPEGGWIVTFRSPQEPRVTYR